MCETPGEPDEYELARCPAGSFDGRTEGTDHQTWDVQVG